jgi:hypothetical protein
MLGKATLAYVVVDRFALSLVERCGGVGIVTTKVQEDANLFNGHVRIVRFLEDLCELLCDQLRNLLGELLDPLSSPIRLVHYRSPSNVRLQLAKTSRRKVARGTRMELSGTQNLGKSASAALA